MVVVAIGETMNTLPKKLISIPQDCDPRSRYHMGGRDNCEHHYVQTKFLNALDPHGRQEWTCLNCDRVCGFYRWSVKG